MTAVASSLAGMVEVEVSHAITILSLLCALLSVLIDRMFCLRPLNPHFPVTWYDVRGAEEQAANVREVKRYKNGFIMDPLCFTQDQTVSTQQQQQQ